MADNTRLNAGSGGDDIATDDIGGVKYQRVKISTGPDGSATDVDVGGGVEAAALRVTVASDSTGVLSVDDNGSTLSVDDGAGSLTVDNAALAVTGGGVEASALRVTLASDSTGVLSVDDNGSTISIDDGAGSITVDGTVAATQSGTWTEANSTAIQTAVELIDDAVYTDGTGTPSKGIAVMGTDGTNPQIVSTNATGHVNIADGGNSITVDGTVGVSGTVAVTDNGGSLTVDNAALSVTGGGVEASALRVTLANDSTGVVSIDDNGSTISVDDGAGSLTVDGTVAATQSGTWTLGANSGTDIGDVDVTSVTPGTGASSLGKAEDAAHTTGDVGVMALGVRKDTGAAIAGTDGDYTPFQTDASGNLRVNVAAGSSAGTEFNEDAAHTTGDAGVQFLAVRKDSAASFVDTDGDYTPLQTDANGALRVTGGGGGTEYVVNAAAPADPTGTASLMERDDALSALTEIEGDWTNMRASANGALWTAVDGTVTVDGSGVTQPVSGTVTANLSATDNAVLDNIDADTSAIQTAVELIDDAVYTDGTGTPSKGLGVMGTDGTNPQLISTNTTGHVNIADGGNSITIDGTVTADAGTGPWPVTDNGGSLTVDNAALSVTGGGVEASALRVTIANDSTGVVSVDDNGSTISVDDGAGSLTVDGTVSITGSVAVTDNAGSLTVDNGGTFAIQDSQKVADNGAFTDGTTPVQPAGFIYDEVAGTALTENDVAAGRINVNRALVGTIEDGVTRGRYATVSASNALKVDGSAVTQPVSGTVAATQSGTWNVGTVTPGSGATNLGKAEDAVHASGDVGVMALGVRSDTAASLAGTSGDYMPFTMDSSGRIYVNSTGTVAHDGVDAGNPHKIGAKAGTSDQTAVANADRTDLRSDVLGHQVVRPYALNENLVQGVTAAITGTADTSVIAAAGAGIRNYITSLTVTNSHASVSTVVEIKDGTTVIHRGYALAAGGGYTVNFPTPLRGTANTAINAANVTTGSNTYVSASGFKAAV